MLPFHVALPALILVAFIAGMAGFVLLAEFWPRKRRDDTGDRDDGAPLPGLT